jgi:dienelactone hydrolase
MSSDDIPEPAVRSGRPRRVRRWPSLRRLRAKLVVLATVAAVVVGGAVVVQVASAAEGTGLGADPTAAMVGSGEGPFGEETIGVPAGNGFGGGTIHVPKGAGDGPFGVVIICPALAAGKGYYEWMGGKAASFGLVTLVIDTNDPGDLFDQRRDQILAAADWLTKSSPVKDKVDASRVGVVGHSAGGGGAINAAQQRPSLKAAVGMAPVGANAGGLKVPTMLVGGTNDGWSSPETLKGLYGSLAGPKSLVEITDGGHGFPAGGSMEMFRAVLPWLKVFVDNDSRYAQFLCPDLSNKSGIAEYQATCPLTPSGAPATGQPAPSPSTSTPAADPTTNNPPASSPVSTSPTGSGSTPASGSGSCRSSYRVVAQWQGGYLADVVVTNGGAPVSDWRLTFDLPSADQRLVQGWNGRFTQSGARMTVGNATWNGSLPTNGSARIGFVALKKQGAPAASNFALNGVACDGADPAPGQTGSTTSAPTQTAPSVTVTSTLPTVKPTTTSQGPALSVDLGSVTKPVTAVGEGFLYGINQDGSQPGDDYLLPLGITAFRGGGHVSRGWGGDGYKYGAQTKAQVDTVIAQAKRITRPPYHAQYQVILSDIYGNDGGQPGDTRYPCDNGDCSNWVTFIDTVVGELQKSGLKFSYDIYNEPDIDIFWKRGMNSPQYFQMWDTAARELRRLGVEIVGPSLAFTPQRIPEMWKTWFEHVKAAGTLPDMITNHTEGDVDDPVAVGQSLNDAMTAAGIKPLPLSANEYQPADRQTAGVTAWYLARFAQSDYANAMRGNWICCLAPNLTGALTEKDGKVSTNGNYWVMRSYADFTGMLVNTSGQVGSTAISAAEDSSKKQAVAIVGDSEGARGSKNLTFSGLSSVPWLSGGGKVKVVVKRIPEQATLESPPVVLNETMSAVSGSITVPLDFQDDHDAFAVYLTPAG